MIGMKEKRAAERQYILMRSLLYKETDEEREKREKLEQKARDRHRIKTNLKADFVKYVKVLIGTNYKTVPEFHHSYVDTNYIIIPVDHRRVVMISAPYWDIDSSRNQIREVEEDYWEAIQEYFVHFYKGE